MTRAILGFLFFLFVGAAVIAWVALRPLLFSRRVERALQHFVKNREALQREFFRAAAASGKPRGLAWKECEFQPGVLLAQDRADGGLVALVAVTVSFEAVEGGGMEEVEAVGNLRAATAVFSHKRRQWSTKGRVVFNLEPREVLERYSNMLVGLQ